MNFSLRVCRWLTSLLLLVIATPAAVARPLDEVVAANRLRVIVYEDNKPFSFEEGDKAKGIDVELAIALAREIGVSAEIVLREAGEKADDDLRSNIWRGPLTGGGTGDVMMHIPTDREFAARNREAVIGNAYFEERIAVAVDPAQAGEISGFDAFKTHKILVKTATAADYFVMFFASGAIRNNVLHFVRPDDGISRYLAKEAVALIGVRSEIEALLYARGAKAEIVEPPMPNISRANWVVGMAVRENSRDLAYALQAALEKIRKSGELKTIFEKYGVTYFTPPGS